MVTHQIASPTIQDLVPNMSGEISEGIITWAYPCNCIYRICYDLSDSKKYGNCPGIIRKDLYSTREMSENRHAAACEVALV